MSLSRNSGRMSAANVGDCRFTSNSFLSLPAIPGVPPGFRAGSNQEVTTAWTSTALQRTEHLAARTDSRGHPARQSPPGAAGLLGTAERPGGPLVGHLDGHRLGTPAGTQHEALCAEPVGNLGTADAHPIAVAVVEPGNKDLAQQAPRRATVWESRRVTGHEPLARAVEGNRARSPGQKPRVGTNKPPQELDVDVRGTGGLVASATSRPYHQYIHDIRWRSALSARSSSLPAGTTPQNKVISAPPSPVRPLGSGSMGQSTAGLLTKRQPLIAARW